LYCPLDQLHRLHGRVQIVPQRFVEKPHVSLVAIATPVMRTTSLPAIKDGFVLALVI
jgi:hypothetical protein